jgi:excisionase family DNA binding protein
METNHSGGTDQRPVAGQSVRPGTSRIGAGGEGHSRISAPASGAISLLTVRQAAALLNISEKTVWRLIGARRIKCIRFNRLVRLEQADVFRFVTARKE